MNFQELFERAMKRRLPRLIDIEGVGLDIGSSGTYKVPGSMALGLPEWNFPRDKIPVDDASVQTIHCYHFLEHLTGDNAILFLREVERVLVVGGIMNYCMPYYNSNLWAHDLTHKSQWNEDSFQNLFKNEYYDPAGSWRLEVHFQIICGIVERNMALIGQLRKV